MKPLIAAAVVLAGVGIARQQKTGDVEGQVRAAAFRHVIGHVFGVYEEYSAATRLPMTVVRDGAFSKMEESQAKAMVASYAESIKKVSDDDRKKMSANLLAAIDDASVQFIGANTANLTFLVKKGAKPEDGDSLATMILHLKDNKWQVIEEITDSKPIPPGYLK